MASPKMFDLSGRVAVVTGGNGGIGRGIALGLAEAGAAVAVLARNEGKNRAVLDELRAHRVPAIAVKVDVTQRAQLKPAIEEVERTLGPVDILVNNAGIALPGGVLKAEPEMWDRVIETNLTASFLLAKYAAQSMAIELAPHNVQVNAIVPGWIESDMTAPIKSRPFYNEILMRTPAGRFGTPEECAGTAIFLASHASDFVTGATIFVDGGYAIR